MISRRHDFSFLTLMDYIQKIWKYATNLYQSLTTDKKESV